MPSLVRIQVNALHPEVWDIYENLPGLVKAVRYTSLRQTSRCVLGLVPQRN